MNEVRDTRAFLCIPFLITLRLEKSEKKETTVMNYAKPEIVLEGAALAAIQCVHKPYGGCFDSALHLYVGTMNAYEADE